MPFTPPRLAAALLRWFLSEEDAEAIAGDLEETFYARIARRVRPAAARVWYWRQVISIVGARIIDRRQPEHTPSRRTPMAAIRQDLSYAMRTLRKQPAFTATAVLMLAIGVGATVAIFSLVNAVLLKPLPFADPERLMLVHMLAPDRESPGVFRQLIWSYPKYRVLRDTQRVFDATGLFTGWNWNLTGSGSPERLDGELVDASYFPVLGVTASIGRTFSADETRAAGSAPLAILGHGFWVRRFGGETAVIGRTVGLNGVPHTIIGVAVPGFRGLTGLADLWVPVTTLTAGDLEEAWNHSYSVVARRKAGVSVDQARQAVAILGGEIDAQYRSAGGGSWSATAVALNDERVAPLVRRSILVLLATVATVLLIVCINLANLMLARGLGREREIGIRIALGASRLRIVRQLMTESLLLALLGAVGGVAVAYAVMSAGAALMPDLRMVFPRSVGQAGGLTRVGLGMVGPDAALLLFTAAIAAGTAVLFGLGPAWRVSRRDLAATMKAGGGGAVSHGSRGFALRNVLIAGEMALALVLLTGGGLMLKSVVKLQATELGFTPGLLLSLRVALPGPQYNPARATQLLDQLLQRLAGRAGIESVAYGSCAPVAGACNGTTATFPDRPPAASGRKPPVGVLWASPRYFETLGIRLVRGRAFTDRDRAGQPKVVVINEAAARTFWPNDDPIGKRIGVGQGGFGDGAEVVGIAADVRYGAVETSVSPDVYLPLLQSPRSLGLIFVRSRAPADSLVPMLRSEMHTLDPDLPLTDVRMMNERFAEATWRTRISAWLLGVFAALALVLAGLGLYGVISQGVAQRTREIGVRMALGAARADIVRLVLSRVVAIAAAGLAIGVILAVPSMQLLTALLYEVGPRDPGVFVTLAFVLLAVALVAGYLPARRAGRVDPLTTLRAE